MNLTAHDTPDTGSVRRQGMLITARSRIRRNQTIKVMEQKDPTGCHGS